MMRAWPPIRKWERRTRAIKPTECKVRRSKPRGVSGWIAGARGCDAETATTFGYTLVKSCRGLLGKSNADSRLKRGPYIGERLRSQWAGGVSLTLFERYSAPAKDDNAWENAGSIECRAQKTREACVGVEVYVAKFPAGMHAAEAKRLLGK